MTNGNHYAQQAEGQPVPTCPNCGREAGESMTRYGIRNQCEPCGLWSWDRHPLVDAETHEARKAAHAVFDALWRGGPMKRGEAYKALRDELGIDKRDCHIKLMDKALASQVPAAVEKIRKELNE